MAVRDRLRRAVTKSDSSDNLSQTSSSTTVATTDSKTSKSSKSSEASSIHKQSGNRLARAFTFGARDKAEKAAKEAEKEKEKERKQQVKAKKSKAALHPRDKPLTAQNLKHQEMLSQFTMTFGSSPNRMSQIITDSDYGVSPCCSRPGSIDGGIISPVTSRNGFDPRTVGVVAE